jgi:nucleotide sugar dehydrogenase
VAGEAGLEDAVADAVARGRLRASADTAECVRQASIVVIIVPVGLTATNEPDFSYLDAATARVGAGLQKGTLVIVETTVPVGTTRHRVAPLLASTSGLTAGRDFDVAFSPERVYSGRIFQDLATYPKVVGGLTDAACRRAATFYDHVLDADIFPVSTAEAAEFVKLLETTYRDVNIAFANECAQFAESHHLDVYEAIAAANTQPFSHIHQPGLGVGGHCIPVYPHFLISSEWSFRLPSMARVINDGMADHGVQLLEAALGGLKDRRVLVLGVTYRANVKETYRTTAIRLIAALRARGSIVLGHDALLGEDELAKLDVEPCSIPPLPAVDAVILHSFHDAYAELHLDEVPGLRVVLDGCHALSPSALRTLGDRDIRCIQVGRVDPSPRIEPEAGAE